MWGLSLVISSAALLFSHLRYLKFFELVVACPSKSPFKSRNLGHIASFSLSFVLFTFSLSSLSYASLQPSSLVFKWLHQTTTPQTFLSFTLLEFVAFAQPLIKIRHFHESIGIKMLHSGAVKPNFDRNHDFRSEGQCKWLVTLEVRSVV
jgi:hypothetical protein